MIAAKHSMMGSENPYRFMRLVISANKGNPDGTQLSEVQLVGEGGELFRFPSDITVSATYNDGNEATGSRGEEPVKLFDGSVNTKMYRNVGESQYPVTVTVDLKDALIRSSEWVTWRWYTANDVPTRDPTAFSLGFSLDGRRWKTVDDVTGFTPTTARKSLAYTGKIKWSTL